MENNPEELEEELLEELEEEEVKKEEKKKKKNWLNRYDLVSEEFDYKKINEFIEKKAELDEYYGGYSTQIEEIKNKLGGIYSSRKVTNYTHYTEEDTSITDHLKKVIDFDET